jgi:predicted flap endonuclease-1-like 5' DNA nuclease
MRTVAVVGGAALLLIWLRPWRRLGTKLSSRRRPQWFSRPAYEGGSAGASQLSAGVASELDRRALGAQPAERRPATPPLGRAPESRPAAQPIPHARPEDALAKSVGAQGGQDLPTAKAQPPAPSAEAVLGSLAQSEPRADTSAERPAEGDLSFEVLDDTGAGASSRQTSGAQTPATSRSGAPAKEASSPRQDVAGSAPRTQAAQTRAHQGQQGQSQGQGGQQTQGTQQPRQGQGQGSQQTQGTQRGAARAVGQSGRRDDLLIIEGIGPRVNLIMEGAGITSFAQLAGTDVDRLRQILRDNGIEVLNPETWPEQARLAADGRMDELRELQGRIKNGRIGR